VEWSFVDYLAFIAEEGWPSLAILGATGALFIAISLPNRQLLAGAPSITAIAVFLLSCYLATLSSSISKNLAYVPIFGLLFTALLVIPSVLALRNKWFGLLHILTLVSAAYLSFICGLAISHDGT